MSIIHQNHWQILDLQRCCSSSLVILLSSHCYHDPIIVIRILSWSWLGALHLHSAPRRLPRRQNRQLSSSPLFSHRGRWVSMNLLTKDIVDGVAMIGSKLNALTNYQSGQSWSKVDLNRRPLCGWGSKQPYRKHVSGCNALCCPCQLHHIP